MLNVDDLESAHGRWQAGVFCPSGFVFWPTPPSWCTSFAKTALKIEENMAASNINAHLADVGVVGIGVAVAVLVLVLVLVLLCCCCPSVLGYETT